MASRKTMALKKLSSEEDTVLLFNMNDKFIDVFIMICYMLCRF